MQTGPPQPKPDKPSRKSAQRFPKALDRSGRGPGRMTRPPGGRTVVAVLGSVAALGGATGSAAAATPPARAGSQRVARSARPADTIPAGELALLGLVFAGLSALAPAIARPLLGRGVASATITEAEADAFIVRLIGTDPGAGGASGVPPGSGTGAGGTAGALHGTGPSLGAGTLSPAAAALFQSVFTAIRSQLPVIAKPLVADALAAGTVTEAQARRIEQRMSVRAHLGGIGLPSGHTEPLFTGRLP
jgi:hypothetical protein